MLGHSKHAFDALRVTYADLNVGLGTKPRSIKYRRAFQENAANCVYGNLICLVSDVVQHLNNRTIEIVSESIGAVFRKCASSRARDLNKPLMGAAHMLHTSRGRQIETEAQVNDGAHDCRATNLG